MKLIKMFLVLMCFIMSSFAVFAATCTTEVTTSGSLIGSRTFNTTISGVTSSDYNATGTLLYGRCTDTANSTYVLLKNDSTMVDWSNSTTGNTGSELNITYNTVGLEDSTGNCAFYTVISNHTQGTNEVTCTATTGKTIDNTAPATPATPTPADATDDDDGDVDFSITAQRATSCTLYVDSDSYTMTHSGDTCTYSLTDMYEANYQWYVISSDGTNTTTGSTYDLFIVGGSGGGSSSSSSSATTVTEDLSILGENVDSFVSDELTTPELKKTGIGIGIGLVAALLATMFFPIPWLTFPVGAVIGGVIGMIL